MSAPTAHCERPVPEVGNVSLLALVFIESLPVGTAQAQVIATVIVSRHAESGDILADDSGNTL